MTTHFKKCSRTIILIFGSLILLSFISCNGDSNADKKLDEFLDVEGNVYKTVQIGDQIWMAENLKTTKYNDGTAIIDGDDDNWSMEEGRFMWASTLDLNDVLEEELAFDFYGAIYNYAAISSGKLAPEGWRIPSEADWEELMQHLSNNGYSDTQGKALKSTEGWIDDGFGDDAFGFNGLAAGYVDVNGTPKANTINSIWALLDQNDDFTYVSANLIHDEDYVLVADNSIWLGSSVRLIRE